MSLKGSDILKTIQYGIFVLDKGGCILWLNPSAATSVGLSQAKCVGKAFADFVPSADTIVKGKDSLHELNPVEGEGGCYLVSAVALNEGVVLLVRDADSLEGLFAPEGGGSGDGGGDGDGGNADMLREELEARERTHSELELRMAQRVEAVGRLAGSVAHEINTPLQYMNSTTFCFCKCFV